MQYHFSTRTSELVTKPRASLCGDSTACLQAVKSPVVTDKQYYHHLKYSLNYTDQSKSQTAEGESDVKQASG